MTNVEEHTRITSVRISSVTPEEDFNGNKQWHLVCHWEWLPSANDWGDHVYVYRERFPDGIQKGTYNVTVTQDKLKKNRMGELYSGDADWHWRWKILSIESLGTAVTESAPEPRNTPAPAPTSKPSNVQYASATAPRPIDENQMRIMRQSTLNYAAILMAPLVKDFSTPQKMVERTVEVSQKFLEYVVSGEMPDFDTPDDDLLEQEF